MERFKSPLPNIPVTKATVLRPLLAATIGTAVWLGVDPIGNAIRKAITGEAQASGQTVAAPSTPGLSSFPAELSQFNPERSRNSQALEALMATNVATVQRRTRELAAPSFLQNTPEFVNKTQHYLTPNSQNSRNWTQTRASWSEDPQYKLRLTGYDEVAIPALRNVEMSIALANRPSLEDANPLALGLHLMNAHFEQVLKMKSADEFTQSAAFLEQLESITDINGTPIRDERQQKLAGASYFFQGLENDNSYATRVIEGMANLMTGYVRYQLYRGNVLPPETRGIREFDIAAYMIERDEKLRDIM